MNQLFRGQFLQALAPLQLDPACRSPPHRAQRLQQQG
eukprot:CAMPEP_0171101594 /NCGR_PEP_ID=MMETSP0766_2-20121228/55480_1 /TAXON_ID=439317 /ORGANISM="Gambierdiscus australes, Strain CAWD 149" /LENGTH=36 /DNA_ID= /DNA_START= /DNA_END= /DNA_ORIENTATION=